MRTRLRSLVLVPFLVLAVATDPARAQQSAPATLQAALHARLAAEMDRVAERLNGVLGYAIKDLSTGEVFYRNADLVFPTASSIKLTVLLELMRQAQEGELSLDEKHTVRRSETPAGDTEPILHFLGDGTVTMTLRDLATFMVVLSDNSATNILIERLEQAFERQRRFTADASHELRTPLSVIRAVTSQKLMRRRTPEEYEEALAADESQVTSAVKATLFVRFSALERKLRGLGFQEFLSGRGIEEEVANRDRGAFGQASFLDAGHSAAVDFEDGSAG